MQRREIRLDSRIPSTFTCYLFAGWANSCKTYVLRLVSDAGRANIKLFKSAVVLGMPANCIAVHRLCSMCLGVLKVAKNFEFMLDRCWIALMLD